MSARLALGSAQFGLAYGIANTKGQVSPAEGAAILQVARQARLDTIDTAIAYGTSEQMLGSLGVKDWRVVSKLPGLPESAGDVARWVLESVAGSLARLRIPALHGLLLHRPQDLLGAASADLYGALQRLKESGAVHKIGVSIYEPEELDALLPRFRIDLVQAPFNILDRRLKTSGWLARLLSLGIEVHSRSAFLQGLLLMPRERRPEQFSRWQPLWRVWDRWREETGESALQACLGFVLAEPGIDRVVVGVDSLEHLSDVLAAAQPSRVPAPDALATQDLDLIHPSRWSVQ